MKHASTVYQFHNMEILQVAAVDEDEPISILRDCSGVEAQTEA